MAVKKTVFFDKTEFVTSIPTGRGKTKIVNVLYDKVSNIHIEKCKEKKGLFFKDSERIVVMVRNLADPIMYYKFKSGPYYEEYKRDFKAFAENNKIRFFDIGEEDAE